MRKKFSLAKRHHKITFVVATCVGTLMSFMVIFGAFSHLPVLGQVNFRITILAVPQCHNGIDDDGDTLIDYPDDPDCKSRDDIFESILPIHPPTVVCFAATSQGRINDTMTWIAIPANGNGTYTYVWSGTDNLTGTHASIDKIYSGADTKTASLVVTSGGLSSPITNCINAIVITHPDTTSVRSDGTGNVGNGGGSAIISPTVRPQSTISGSDIIPQPTTTTSSEGNTILLQPDCQIPALGSNVRDYTKYLTCTHLIIQRSKEEEYRYTQPTLRKELLGVAVKTALKDKDSAVRDGLNHLLSQKKSPQITDIGLSQPLYFSDIGPDKQPAWVEKTVYAGVILGLVSPKNTVFRPNDLAIRSEAFAIMMKAVCMNPEESPYSTWEEQIYDTARKSNITERSWEDFEPKKAILRQDLFVIAAKLDNWRQKTGGCTPFAKNLSLLPVNEHTSPLSLSLASAPLRTPASLDEVFIDTILSPEKIQEVFTPIYENVLKKLYGYRVKSGGMPDDVRSRYLQLIPVSSPMSRKIDIQNIVGVEFPENRWLLSGELVYVVIWK